MTGIRNTWARSLGSWPWTRKNGENPVSACVNELSASWNRPRCSSQCTWLSDSVTYKAVICRRVDIAFPLFRYSADDRQVGIFGLLIGSLLLLALVLRSNAVPYPRVESW